MSEAVVSDRPEWSGSPGFWGVMSAAAEHAHCHTTLESVQVERGSDTAHGKKLNRWKEVFKTPVPPDAKIRAHGRGGECLTPYSPMYVDHYLLIRIQHSDGDTTALTFRPH